MTVKEHLEHLHKEAHSHHRRVHHLHKRLADHHRESGDEEAAKLHDELATEHADQADRHMEECEKLKAGASPDFSAVNEHSDRMVRGAGASAINRNPGMGAGRLVPRGGQPARSGQALDPEFADVLKVEHE